MTTATFMSQPGGSQTLATFKGWSEAFHNALIAVGLVQTSDTGQISFASITTLPAAGILVGYGIYRFNDTMQSSAPLFLRVEYRTISNSRGRLDIVVGSATDGAGNLTPFGATISASTSGTSGSTVPTFVAAGDGYLTIALWCGTTSTLYGGFIAVERSRSTSAPTADGLLIASGSSSIFTYIYSTAVPFDHSGYLTIPKFAATNSLGAGVTAVFPFLVAFISGADPWQPISVLGISPIDRPMIAFPVTLNGTTRTYLAPDMYSTGVLATPTANSNTVMLYE